MISIQNVQKSFGGTKAINGLNLSVRPGQIYGLLGPNGAGKSTTINLLLGLLAPDSGKVELDGKEVLPNLKTLQKITGYIPENVSLYPYLTAKENLEYFCKLSGIIYSKIELKNILIKSGLEENAIERRMETYSKGMRQKVGIAIALAKKARIYLLDEPASGLDPISSSQLTTLLKSLSAEGATILMVSHDLFRVGETCDQIGILKQGELIKDIKTEGLTSIELEKIYLDFMHNKTSES